MADQPRPLPIPELERTLADLGAHLVFPATPDLAQSVRARLAAQPAPARTAHLLAWPWSASPRRTLLAAALALLVAASAFLAAFPGARSAVAEWFGLDGVRIVVVDETPPPAASPVGPNLLLGERVTLEDARTRVPFELALLDVAAFGAPDEVYVREVASGTMVSLLYRPRADLPEAAETGVGALLMQFDAETDGEILSKRVRVDSPPMEVRVGDTHGLWVFGTSSLVINPDPSIGFEGQAGRSSANILFWQRDGVTYRLETALSRQQAVVVAEATRPDS